MCPTGSLAVQAGLEWAWMRPTTMSLATPATHFPIHMPSLRPGEGTVVSCAV